MNLQAHYDTMCRAALARLTQGDADLDSLIDADADNRRGITLLARPPARIITAIAAVLDDFRAIEPDQYYYPASDIHLTVLSIISCYSGFALAQINLQDYCRAVQAIVHEVPGFSIRFAGLTASPGSIMVQGEPLGPDLEHLRNKTRAFFQQAGLPHSIDQRYNLQTAHATIIRFRQPLQNPQALTAKIEHYRRQPIGTFEVDTLELVFNDWYQRQANTVLLERYPLSGRL